MQELTHEYIGEERKRKIELLTQAFDTLTARESQVVAFLACGLSNKQIARQLSTCEGTVKVQLHSIAIKLGFDTCPLKRTAIAIMAIRYGGYAVSDKLLLSFVK